MNKDFEVFKELNGIEFSKSEVYEHLTYNGVTVSELKAKGSMLNTEVSEKHFQEMKEKVISSLEHGERIDAYIKGLSESMLELMILMAQVSPGALLKTDEYGFNYSIFITNKRIFISDTNYYNKDLRMSIYNLDEIEEIAFNREKLKKNKRTFKEWVNYGLINSLKKLCKGSLYTVGMLPVVVAFGTTINFFIGFGPFNPSGIILSVIPIGILALIIRHFTAPKLKVSMRLKNGRELDFLVVNNGGVGLINNCLKEIKKKL